MKFMTKALEKRFAQVGSQQDKKDPLVIARFYNPAGAATWFATEYDPKSQYFHGHVSMFSDWEDEWNGFSLEELAIYNDKAGLKVERDLDFDETPFSKIRIF